MIYADVSKVLAIDDIEGIGSFFDGFALSRQENGA